MGSENESTEEEQGLRIVQHDREDLRRMQEDANRLQEILNEIREQEEKGGS